MLIFLIANLVFGCHHPTSDDPAENKTSTHRVILRITANTMTYANAYVYDVNGNFISGAIFKVDGVTLAKMSYNGYYSSLVDPWTEGSVHSFSVTTPDGCSSGGSVTKPTGTLSGVIFEPPSPTLANSYTATPPSGGWPTGSFISCTTVNNGYNYGIDKEPTGTSPVTFSGSEFIGATSVSFTSALMTKVVVEGYSTSSFVSVTGTTTSW
jgi:hypothetical protein